ncbi:hypothetical protein ON010_g17249 [Phytophthora cinnamomi]|nr:hypothetical protein ON010_g17249 [Phytophthora cinnamomi]
MSKQTERRDSHAGVQERHVVCDGSEQLKDDRVDHQRDILVAGEGYQVQERYGAVQHIEAGGQHTDLDQLHHEAVTRVLGDHIWAKPEAEKILLARIHFVSFDANGSTTYWFEVPLEYPTIKIRESGERIASDECIHVGKFVRSSTKCKIHAQPDSPAWTRLAHRSPYGASSCVGTGGAGSTISTSQYQSISSDKRLP